jgi:hypothetical protein
LAGIKLHLSPGPVSPVMVKPEGEPAAGEHRGSGPATGLCAQVVMAQPRHFISGSATPPRGAVGVHP